MEINFQGDILQNVISIEIKLSKQGIIVDKQKFCILQDCKTLNRSNVSSFDQKTY